MRIFTGFVLVVLAGCTGDLVELGVGPKQDMSFAGVDLSQGGGGEMGLSNAKFFPDIQMDIDAKGCTITACHGAAGTGTLTVLKAAVTAQADIDTNYMNLMMDLNLTTPDQSPFLTKPTATSGVTHSGTKPLTSTSDPTYIKWKGWIQAGAPKQ